MLSLARPTACRVSNQSTRLRLCQHRLVRASTSGRPVKSVRSAAAVQEPDQSVFQAVLAPSYSHDGSAECTDKLLAAASALQECSDGFLSPTSLSIQQSADLVGAAAAGTWKHGTTAALQVCRYTSNGACWQESDVRGLVERMQERTTGFSDVVVDGAVVRCTYDGLKLCIVLLTQQAPPNVLQLLDPQLSKADRQSLSSSTVVASTAFLRQMSALGREAAGIAKCWAHQQLQVDEYTGQANRSFDYLLDLLVFEAYQTYITATAAEATFGSVDSNSTTALDTVLRNFLQLLAQLPRVGVLSWEGCYRRDVVLQVLASTALTAVLRPRWCEQHPLVLDPADPTNNVAAALTADQLQQLAAAAAAVLAQVDSSAAAAVVQPRAATTAAAAVATTTAAAAAAEAEDAAVEADRAEAAEEARAKLEQQEAEGFEWIETELEQMLETQRDVSAALERMQEEKREAEPVASKASRTWSLNAVPISKWLPGAKTRSVRILECNGVPGLKLRVLATCLNATPLKTSMGIEVCLVADEDGTSPLSVLADSKGDVPVTILKGSSICVTSRASSFEGLETGAWCGSRDDVELDRDIRGKLGADKGLIWELSRPDCFYLGISSCGVGCKPEDDVSVLQAQVAAGCRLHFKLRLKFGE